MRTFIFCRNSVFFIGVLVGVLACGQEDKSMPTYLANAGDPVQREYSTALLGFAVEKKCSLLQESKRKEYENYLNFDTEIFRPYILLKGMIHSPAEALNYPTDMAFGSIRFAASLPCDATSKELVDKGFEAAQDFKKILDLPLAK